MAKMFYSIEEAAERLKVSTDAVREMVAKGQLAEYRDRDQLRFKREQVDILAGDDAEDSATIPLADSGEMSLLSADESKTMDTGTKERSGISIFEADEGEEIDASAQTQVTASVGGAPAIDPGASGSGLLDLTRESDDTSLGANLLEDVYGSKAGEGSGAADQGALFEPAGVASDVSPSASPMVMAVAEPYDGTWSGIAGGLALGMTLILALALAIAVFTLTGATNIGLVQTLAGNYWMWVGILGALVVIPAVVGLVMGKRS